MAGVRVMKSNAEIYEFGAFRLEVRERRLLQNGQPVQLRGKVFDTLRTLVENHGSLVTKDVLMRAVWPDAAVEEGNLAHNVTVLRKVLGDIESRQHVETVPGRGYRFVAAVRMVVDEQPAVQPAAGSWEGRLAAARAALAAKSLAGVEAPVNGPVVGRARELSELQAGMESAFSGRACVYCITGEPGIGKTTLFQHFLADGAARGVNYALAAGRCSEMLGGSEAYLPILEALESLLAGPLGPELAELMKLAAPTWYVQVAPLWVSSEPAFGAILAEARGASRERMKRELAAFFEEVSRVVPVVLFLDDLHWADLSTTELLSYLARRLAAARLLIIVAYRPSDILLAGHPFVSLQQELKRQNLCREVRIELLSRLDIEDYLRLEFSSEKLTEGLAEFVHQRTEGNPLFMSELVRRLHERGMLQQPLEFLARDLPESVRATIQRRIDQLDTDELALLSAASVQGQEFDSRIVADVLGVDAAVVEERLARLERVHGFVRRLHDKELPDCSISVSYSFAHVLYQHAIDESLAPSRRMALSLAAGEAVLARYRASPSNAASRLGMLFEAAHDFERAANFFLLAAVNAAAIYANEEALNLSRRSIANAEKLQGSACHARVGAAASEMAQIQMVLSRFQDASSDFAVAERAAVAADDIEAQVNAICGVALAQFYQRKMDETREAAGRALAIAKAAKLEPAIAMAEAVLGMERMCLGETVEARHRFSRSIPVLIDRAPPPHALETVAFSGLLHAWALDYEASHRIVNRTLQRSRDIGSQYHIVLSLLVRGMALFNEGRLSEGLGDLQEGMRLAERNRERFWLSRFPNTLGWAYRELGDYETAFRLDAEGAQIAREQGYVKPEANSLLNLATDYMTVGETPRALEHLNRAADLFERDVWFRWRYNIRTKAEFAWYWLLQGDTGQAQRYALEAVALAGPRKARKHLAWGHKILGDVAVAEERPADGLTEYQTALRALQRHRCPLIEWRILLAAAETASACRQNDAAERYRGRCRQVIQHLAGSIKEEGLRRQLLGSETIRRALS
jgi:DNA-binding winged helix-turn-helix (wHTH) protein/tetratricopeptide (TPR) repeat protein